MNRIISSLRFSLFVLVLLLAGKCALAAAPADAAKPELSQTLVKAQKLFQEQNWAEARTAFDQARVEEGDWHSSSARLAVEGSVACALKLQLWDDATARAKEFVAQNKGRFEEAVGERFLAGVQLTLPHYGVKQGGTFLRGQGGQGVYVTSFKKDRKEAIKGYQRARDLLIALSGKFGSPENPDTAEQRALIHAERIGIDFDLTSVLAQPANDGGLWNGWSWWWSSGEAEEDSAAVEEADYEEPRYGYRYNPNPPLPNGLPLGPDGQPVFVPTPAVYSDSLGDGGKIRFLLAEVATLDDSAHRDAAAQALMRRAMICRRLYGPDVLQTWRQSNTHYDRMGRAIPPNAADEDSLPKKQIWELGDNEAIAIAGGRLRVVELPVDESPLALLGEIEKRYPESSVVPEAIYSRALYFQSRQQFPQAIAEYGRLKQSFPKNTRVADAEIQIALIHQGDVQLEPTHVYLPGVAPVLGFSFRNAAEVNFTARRFDLADRFVKYMTGEKGSRGGYWTGQYLQDEIYRDIGKGVGQKAIAWSEKLPATEGDRTGTAKTEAPLSEPGAYMVEATVAGSDKPSRTLVIVTDIAIVRKYLEKSYLLYVADARTGQPLRRQRAQVLETWQEYKQNKTEYLHKIYDVTTDNDGVVQLPITGHQVELVVSADRGRTAISLFQNWGSAGYGPGLLNGPRIYIMTDRPVYRPGATVKFRAWMRELNEGAYREPRADQAVSMRIYDPKNTRLYDETLKTDETGAVTGEFTVAIGAPLGLYRFEVNGQSYNGYYHDQFMAGGTFRVEEYKRPEFEVKVTPGKMQARLGEKVTATVAAKYYFGAPVAKGEVSYKVFREDYQHVYWGPGEFDWLYGRGYGRYVYAYPWLPWWGRWGCFICCDFPFYGYGYGWNSRWGYNGDGGDVDGLGRRSLETGTRKALRELVAQGHASLKEDGTYDIEFDTAAAKKDLADRDHRYTIEAEVRDASRRTITGQGEVKVTRQEFYAFAETANGWYRPQQEAFVEVRTLTPGNTPVATHGKVSVSRLAADDRKEEEIKSWDAETDADGRLSFKFPVPAEGQYRVTYRTTDSWQQEVQANAVFWAAGPGFDGQVYRFNDLEIIADKRTYKPGDVAHLLINTAEANSRILFSDQVSQGTLRSWRFIDLPQRSTIVEIPITKANLPNFFVEATLIRNGHVFQEMRELFVPPTQGLLNLSVKTDRERYQPGEEGRVKVLLTDANGKPVVGSVTLSAFDESITYIQDETAPAPKKFFYGQRRYHQPLAETSLDRSFTDMGQLARPETDLSRRRLPEGWLGYWGLISNGQSLAFDLDLRGGLRRSGALNEAGQLSMDGSVATGAASLASTSPMVAAMPTPASSSIAGGLFGDQAQKDKKSEDREAPGGVGGEKVVEPAMRSNFAETALWAPHLTTNEKGEAEATVIFPDSLTTWRVRGYGITNSTQVGDGTGRAITSKNLIVRLQTPRFLVERDEVVISANVHNYLSTEKEVAVELSVPAKQFVWMDHPEQKISPAAEGDVRLTAKVKVAANGEQRCDWRLKVVSEGLAKLSVKALTNEESDAMQMSFPVIVHGIVKTVVQSGSFRIEDRGARTLSLDLPEEINAEQTKLELTFSPSLAGAMIDALPYLSGYPYGCVEQTMSRFYPTILVRKTLKEMGLNLEQVAEQRKQMNAADLRRRFDRDPVFDTKELNKMVRAGLQRLATLQHDDGGWGWWRDDESSPFQTAYVIQGLQAAQGEDIPSGMYQRGISFLKTSTRRELRKAKEKQELGSAEMQASLAYVLTLTKNLDSDDLKKWMNDLYDARADLNNYGKALLALACAQDGQAERAQMLLRNVLQFADGDDSNATAWIRTPEQGWWFWYNNDIETNACVLKALAKIDPKNPIAPRLVKWLLNNRRNGYYWRSTRDTAQVIAAMTEYMRAAGEASPDYQLLVKLDGDIVKQVRVTKENFFTFDNRFLLYGLQLKPGKHTVTIEKEGVGALYYSSYLSYFTKEEDIKGAGNEIEVTREYFLLKPYNETVNAQPRPNATLPAGQAQPVEANGREEVRAGYERVPLKNGDDVASGQQIEVVLKIKAKNTYDFLAFEDMKPAGCEPVELRSGGRFAGGLCPNVELRDDRVVFFIGLLEQGQHLLRYKLRAEMPGKFHALPTTGSAMYAPEVRAISDEMVLGIHD